MSMRAHWSPATSSVNAVSSWLWSWRSRSRVAVVTGSPEGVEAGGTGGIGGASHGGVVLLLQPAGQAAGPGRGQWRPVASNGEAVAGVDAGQAEGGHAGQ